MRKAGIALILLGLLLIIGSAGLLIHNQREDALAGISAGEQLNRLVEQIRVQKEEQEQETHTATPEEEEALLQELTPVPTEVDKGIIMDEIQVDGKGYIGYISFPTLELDLPVMSNWTVEKLYTSPCHYFGSVQEGNLVIMAHNYSRHFGRITELRNGDPVYFINAFGEAFFYQVEFQEILPSNCIPQLTSGEFDLTLFTCTYGGANRITVRCNEAPPPK